MRKHYLIVAALALIVAGAAQGAGNPIQKNPVVAKVDAPVFLAATPACPEGRAHTRLVAEEGAVLGSSFRCLAEVRSDDDAGTFTETGTLVLHLPGGTIVASTTFVYYFATYPDVLQTISGTVTLGTGIYRGASGTLSGGGTIRFDEAGNPHPDSTLVVNLA